MTTTAKFQGMPLIEVPKDVSKINILRGVAFGKQVLAEYNGRVQKDYKDFPVLKVLQKQGNLVTGSNPFAVVFLNRILAPNYRTATQADLETVLRLGSDKLDLRGTYEDTGFVLRSEDEPNTYLAKDLVGQLKTRYLRIKYPLLIHLKDLELRLDQNLKCGLAFNLKESTEIVYTPVLNKGGYFNSESINKSTGLPKKTTRYKDKRILHAGNSGLSLFCLTVYLDLCSNEDDLMGSNSDGRVVVVKNTENSRYHK